MNRLTSILITFFLGTGNVMADYNDVLNAISKDKNVSPERLEELMDSIMRWESSRTKSKIVPNAIQLSTVDGQLRPVGPGRGAFQFEQRAEDNPLREGSGAAVTARNRLKEFLKSKGMDQPNWLKNLPDNFDPATLDLEQQKMLFLGDGRMAKGKNFSEIAGDNPSKTFGEWWADYHKALGSEKLADDVIEFDRLVNERRIQPINTSTSEWIVG